MPRLPHLAPSRRPVRRTAVLAVAGLATLVVPLLGATSVAAHSDEGEMTVTRADASGSTVTVEVGIVYAGDQHLAEEAEVWVDASAPGTQLEPVPLQREGGDSSIYTGEFEVPTPGDWTLAVQSRNPTATATATVTVGAEATTTSTAPTSSTSTTAAADADTATIDRTTSSTADEADEDDDDGVSVGLVVAGVVVLLVVAGGAWYLLRRREAAERTVD